MTNTIIVRRQYNDEVLEDLHDWCDRVQVLAIHNGGQVHFIDSATAVILTRLK